MPFIQRSVLRSDVPNRISKKYEATVFTFNEKQLQKIYDIGMVDHGHATEAGAELYAEYFALFFRNLISNLGY